MTGYTVHTGTSKKFVSGWDRVFSSKAESDKSPEKAVKKVSKPKTKTKK
jgi:hypothetical protein